MTQAVRSRGGVVATALDNLNPIVVRHGYMSPFDSSNQTDDGVNETRDGKNKRRTCVFRHKTRAITESKEQADVKMVRQWTVRSKSRFEID